MAEVLDPRLAPQVVDDLAIRRQLREQVARLEGELGALFCSAYPRTGFEWNVRSRGGPRVLSLSELEEVRDELAAKLQHNRRVLGDRTYVEELNRRRIEEMMLAPERHKFVRVRNEDIGERGCKQWHVLPRFGVVGMLMNWWRVKISSGCPLPKGPWPPARCPTKWRAAPQWSEPGQRCRRAASPLSSSDGELPVVVRACIALPGRSETVSSSDG